MEYSSASDVSDLDDEEVSWLLSPELSLSSALLPLEYVVWTDHVQKGMTKDDYMASLKPLFTFRDLRTFHAEFDKRRLADMLAQPDVSIRVFQAGIEPIWEAPANRNGGKWMTSFAGVPFATVLQKYHSLVAGMCSGSFSVRNSGKLVGVVLSVRDWGLMLALWSTDSDTSMVSKVKRKLRKLLDTHSVKYSAHQETIEKNAAAELSSSATLTRKRAPTNPSTVSSDEEMVSARQRHQAPSVTPALTRPPLTVHQSPLTISARMPTPQSCIDLATVAKILVVSLVLAVVAMYVALPKRSL